MSETRNRKLAAILFADIVGYTAMMQKDEALARNTLARFHQALNDQVTVNHGEVINDLGDGCLVIFNSAVDATNCALALQQAYISEPQVPVRIGLHSGDVFFEHNNVYGDAVNLASRIESLGVPGSVLFSETIRAQIHNKPEFEFKSLGEFDFKNVQKKMEVFALKNIGLPIPKRAEMMGKLKAKKSKAVPALLAGMLFALGLIGFLLSPWGPYGQQAYAKTLAVMPFATQDGGQTEFAENVSAEVLEALRKSKGVEIPATALSPSADTSGKNLRDIGETLNVAHILKGDIKRTGDKTEVIVKLIRTKDGKEIWSETFLTEGEDTSAITAKIASDVGQTVPNQIKAAAKAEETKPPTPEPAQISEPKSEPPSPPVEGDGPLQTMTFRAMNGDGKLLSELLQVNWDIRPLFKTEKYYRFRNWGGEIVLELPYGPYSVKAHHGENRKAMEITVSADGEKEYDWMFIDGKIILTPKMTPGSDPLTGVFGWDIYKDGPEGRIKVAGKPGDAVSFRLAPGVYQGEFNSKGVKQAFDFTIKANETLKRDIVLNAAKVTVRAQNTEGVGAVGILNLDGEEIIGDMTSSGHWFHVPAGDYLAFIRFGKGNKTKPITVVAGKEMEVVIDNLTEP